MGSSNPSIMLILYFKIKLNTILYGVLQSKIGIKVAHICEKIYFKKNQLKNGIYNFYNYQFF